MNSNLDKNDSEYLDYLRGIAIFGIVLGHLCGWLYKPYSEYLFAPLVPIFFFISGAVSFYSFIKSDSSATYYKKRLISLLVPYYLICLFSLAVYIALNKKVPVYSLAKLLSWLQITPTIDITPFPLGQIWFLNTLILIIIISPIYFKLYQRNNKYILLILTIILAISAVQLTLNVSQYLKIGNNNIYKPVTNSIFFLYGMIWFTSSKEKKSLIMIIITSVLTCYILLKIAKLSIYISVHDYSPDLYYICVNITVISLILLMQKHILKVIYNIPLLKTILVGLNKQTYSIYLLHSFAIYITERYCGLIHPHKNFLLYGLTKFTLVLLLSIIIAIPFTGISHYLIKRIMRILPFRR